MAGAPLVPFIVKPQRYRVLPASIDNNPLTALFSSLGFHLTISAEYLKVAVRFIRSVIATPSGKSNGNYCIPQNYRGFTSSFRCDIVSAFFCRGLSPKALASPNADFVGLSSQRLHRKVSIVFKSVCTKSGCLEFNVFIPIKPTKEYGGRIC